MIPTAVVPNHPGRAEAPPPASGAYAVDISRGERLGRVSSEWFSRPDDERYLSLGDLYAAVRARSERAVARTVESRAIRVEAARDNPERLKLRVERGYVRPEDELPIEAESHPEPDQGTVADSDQTTGADGCPPSAPQPPLKAEKDEAMRPIPDRLMTELTAHRTLALRDALGERPDVAVTAVLHSLALQCFYHYAVDSCLQLTATVAQFSTQAPGLNDSWSARSLDGRHKAWIPELPKDSVDLWGVLAGWGENSHQALFAHCVAQTVNAVQEPWNRRPRALVHADQLAEAVGLDMVQAGWTTTADSFLGRVVKARGSSSRSGKRGAPRARRRRGS